MMLARVCSPIRLQLDRRCVALQASRGLTAHLDKQKQSHLQQGQMSGQHIRSTSSLHDHAPSRKENNLRDILGFPIVTVPLKWKMNYMKYNFRKTWPFMAYDFDHLEFSRGVVANLVVLTDLIKQGSPTKVRECYIKGLLTKGGYRSILNAITESQNNPQIANEMVIKESDVVDVSLHFTNILKQPFTGPLWHENYPSHVVQRMSAKVTYVNNFEQKLGDQFSFNPKEGASMDTEKLKRMQKKVMDIFKRDSRVCYIVFSRTYEDGSLNTPLTGCICHYLVFVYSSFGKRKLGKH